MRRCCRNVAEVLKEALALETLEALQEIERRKALQEAVGTFIMLLLIRFSEFEQLNDSSAVQSLLVQLGKLIPACGISYLDAITGSFFKAFMDSISKDLVDEDGAIFDVRQGSALAVWWIFCFGEKAAAVSQEVKQPVVDGVTSSRHAFLSALSNVSVLLQCRARRFHDLDHHGKTRGKKKLSQQIIRKVLPPFERFQALKQLITDCEHSSMGGFNLSVLCIVRAWASATTCFRMPTQVYEAFVGAKRRPFRKGKLSNLLEHVNSPFVTEKVLELVDFVLRPPVGCHPDLPNQIDAVLSALNFYRFLLIKETTGKSNYTGVASHTRLEEASSKWLQPLRAVLQGVKRDCSADSSSEVTAAVLLAISNLEGVLYRCLELAEAALKQHSS
ncbi:hypothetical protein L7F22_046878 [Adiantum nelumboides]|nr:hypothetical protein [Adiantum nelumboides]